MRACLTHRRTAVGARRLWEKRYGLEAYARYKGRCYQAHENEWLDMHRAAKHPQFLIMSGLYSLIPPTEYIQNYDVHLTDIDLSTGISLQTYWRDRDLMTQVLISHLEWLEREKGPIGHVIDALSELSYQETINWSLIDRRWNVLHRVFESSAGRTALGNLGVWLQDAIRNPLLIRSIQSDHSTIIPAFIPKIGSHLRTRSVAVHSSLREKSTNDPEHL